MLASVPCSPWPARRPPIALALRWPRPPPSAITGGYVALGDSYSSGVGAGSYTSASGSCDRSTNAYSALWNNAHHPSSYVSVACSGAKTTDVNANQLSALSSATGLVSITIGGNDVGFSNIMQTCVLGHRQRLRRPRSTPPRPRPGPQLPGLLNTTYNNIRSHAPNAQVVVLDYPVFYHLNVSSASA